MSASAAFSQSGMKWDPAPTPLNCELFVCACEPKPGKVDRCIANFTFKNTNKGVVRLENNDPKACGQSVENNLSSLAKHYAKRPEVGLPTREMATFVDSLIVPEIGALPDSRLLEATEPTDPSRPLDKRIQVATSRIEALAADASAFAEVAAATVAWQQASSAAGRLVARADGAVKLLSLGRQWPAMAEFGPKVWDIVVCQRVQTAAVAKLGVRLLDDKDDAWKFAFYDDWEVFLKPFGAQRGDEKTLAFESIARPFFAEPVERVRERSDKTLFTSLDVRAFKEAVETKATVLLSYVDDRSARTRSGRDKMLATFEREAASISDIRAALKRQQDTVTSIKDAIDSANSQRAKITADIAALDTSIANATSALAMHVAERDQLRVDRAAADAAMKVKSDAVNAAQMALDAVVLNCGGSSYENCNDDKIRREYDRQRYKANVTLSTARAELTDARERSMIVTDRLFAKEVAVHEQRAGLAGLKDGMTGLLKSRNERDAQLVTLNADLQKRESEVLPLTQAMAKLDQAVQALDRLRPG